MILKFIDKIDDTLKLVEKLVSVGKRIALLVVLML